MNEMKRLSWLLCTALTITAALLSMALLAWGMWGQTAKELIRVALNMVVIP